MSDARQVEDDLTAALRSLTGPQINQNQNNASGARQRAKTTYKGVTKTTTSTAGIQKYDVQFVFCDGGTKKHPKIYGFPTEQAAARAFDVLVIRRTLEKNKSIDPVVLGDQHHLGNNFPLSDYQDNTLVDLLQKSTRDDIIYGLKMVVKQGYAFDATSLVTDLKNAIDFATRDADHRSKCGDPRMSYQPTPKPPGGNASGSRKRKASANVARAIQSASYAANVDPTISDYELEDDMVTAAAGLTGLMTAAAVVEEQDTAAAALANGGNGGGRQSGFMAVNGGGDGSQYGGGNSGSGRGARKRTAGKTGGAGGGFTTLNGDNNSGSVVVPNSINNGGGVTHLHDALLGLLHGQKPDDDDDNTNINNTKPHITTTTTIINNPNNLVPPQHQQEDQDDEIDGVKYLLEICQIAFNSQPEMMCVMDLIKLWSASQSEGLPCKNGQVDLSSLATTQQYNLPPDYYQPFVEQLVATNSLRVVLGVIQELSRSGTLRDLLVSVYSTVMVPGQGGGGVQQQQQQHMSLNGGTTTTQNNIQNVNAINTLAMQQQQQQPGQTLLLPQQQQGSGGAGEGSGAQELLHLQMQLPALMEMAANGLLDSNTAATVAAAANAVQVGDLAGAQELLGTLYSVGGDGGNGGGGQQQQQQQDGLQTGWW